MVNVIIDVEANSLVNPTKIWVIVCRDTATDNVSIFRKVTDDEEEKQRFFEYASNVKRWIGHNILGYDYPVLNNLLGFVVDCTWPGVCDTLVASKLFNYSRKGGHSLESYGEEFGIEKNTFSDFTKYSKELEDRCVRDTEINLQLYRNMASKLDDKLWFPAIRLEQMCQVLCEKLRRTGFCFDTDSAGKLLDEIQSKLGELDDEIDREYPARLRLVREIHPKLTTHGTLNRSDFRWHKSSDLSEFTGDPFCRCEWVQFNKNSHKQLIDVLSLAKWSPTEKTAGHVEKARQGPVDEKTLKYGWKINEINLETLPKSAPNAAKLLAKRILLESRRRTLTEWLALVNVADGRIHGRFYGIGAWTHRMAHQEPNTANIPSNDKLYGKEFRSLWHAGNGRLLVGADAEGIQLRIFAHYINDQEFIDALVRGKKSDKTDPHSLNQRVLGSICKSRQDAKRFIYAYLLGAGLGKLAQVLGASQSETQQALDNLLLRYTGLAKLKATTIPKDAKRGYFIGLDNRQVPIPGETGSERKHLVMSGYLQNGEAIVMKRTAVKLDDYLQDDEAIVDIVHDEVIVETSNDRARANKIGNIFNQFIGDVGRELNLRCPLAGEYHIGQNWSETH